MESTVGASLISGSPPKRQGTRPCAQRSRSLHSSSKNPTIRVSISQRSRRRRSSRLRVWKAAPLARRIDGYQEMVEEYNAAIQETVKAKEG